eukprot:scaffold2034_cov124-Isochrysis_galbana.AAC.4
MRAEQWRLAAALRACALKRPAPRRRWARLQLDHTRAFATAPTPGASTLDAPFISDTMPLAEGIIGELGELCVAVGDAVDANDVIAVIETGGPGHALVRSPTSASTLPILLLADKAAISVKASTSGVIAAILVEIDEPIVESMPMFELR